MKQGLLLVLPVMACMVVGGCGIEAPQTMSQNARMASDGGVESASEDAIGDAGAEDPVITMIMAEVNPLDSIAGMTDLAFKEKVEELSAGSIQIDLQAGGVLGPENAVLDKMLGGEGTIDLARISAFALTSYGGTKSALLSIPYTFEDRDHFWRFAESDLAQELLMEPMEHGSGVRGLFYGEEGFRHFFTASKVKDVGDFNEMKVRVSNDPIMEELVRKFGADPVFVPFDELYDAFQHGEVDGAEQPVANYLTNAFQKVAPYLILDGHTLGAIQVIITEDAWNDLTKEQQEILLEAGDYASRYNRRISLEKEIHMLKALEQEGCIITEIEDIAPWREASADMADTFSSYHKELYQQILEIKE